MMSLLGSSPSLLWLLSLCHSSFQALEHLLLFGGAQWTHLEQMKEGVKHWTACTMSPRLLVFRFTLPSSIRSLRRSSWHISASESRTVCGRSGVRLMLQMPGAEADHSHASSLRAYAPLSRHLSSLGPCCHAATPLAFVFLAATPFLVLAPLPCCWIWLSPIPQHILPAAKFPPATTSLDHPRIDSERTCGRDKDRTLADGVSTASSPAVPDPHPRCIFRYMCIDAHYNCCSLHRPHVSFQSLHYQSPLNSWLFSPADSKPSIKC